MEYVIQQFSEAVQHTDLSKLFFVDACRGDQIVPRGGKKVSQIVPEGGNLLVAYSTLPKHKSYEDNSEKGKGGVWMSKLAEKLRTDNSSIHDVLTIVNEELMALYRANTSHPIQQPEFHSNLNSRIFFFREKKTPSLNAPSDEDGKGQHRATLNYKKQTKEICELNFEDFPQEKGLFLARVTFKVTATEKQLSFTSSPENKTKKEAHEDVARVACLYLDPVPVPVPGQTPDLLSPKSYDRNPLERLKEGCESGKPKRNYKYVLTEIPTGNQKFMYKVTLKNENGRVLCEQVGSECGNKKDAQHDAASRVNKKLRF